MRPHPYLRAYMAGIVVPTAFLLVIMIVFAYFRFYFEVPSQFVVGLPGRPLERAIVFPMAVVPNLWGLAVAAVRHDGSFLNGCSIVQLEHTAIDLRSTINPSPLERFSGMVGAGWRRF